MTEEEVRILRIKQRRFLLASLFLTAFALLLTYVASEVRSVWLMILAFSLIVASMVIMFYGLTLRVKYLLLKEVNK